MARYVLLGAHAGAPPGMPYQKFAAGRTVCDTAGNALAGGSDVVWAALCANPTNRMAPLDAAAAAVMVTLAATGLGQGGTGYTTTTTAAATGPNGADSVG